MKSRLRERIRKVNLDLDKKPTSIIQKKQTARQKQFAIGKRQFGKDITTYFNKNSIQPETSITESQIKSRALERKRVTRMLKKRQSSPQFPIQNIQLAIVPCVIENKQKLDIFNKMVLNCQHVNNYLPDICQYLSFRDKQMPLFQNILSQQYQVNQKMRITLVDWIMRIHLKFKLKDETLFKTINILDNYTISGKIIKKRQYQLLGITSLYIACKYEQIYPPANSSYTNVCAKLYTFENILQMEGLILKNSQFNVGYCTSITHIQRFIIMLNLSNQQSNIAKYLVQLGLFNLEIYSFSPMTIASAVIILTKKIIRDQEQIFIGLSFDQQKTLECTNFLQKYISQQPFWKSEYVIYEKYSSEMQKVLQFFKQ